jgi:enamine deaminase RidA (YjgF/YER057c/UK114 family)
MNYCEKIRYRIFTAKKETFPVMIDCLLRQLPEGEHVLRLTFFGTPSSNEEYLIRQAILKNKVEAFYSNGRMPALSYVSQPPLDAPLIVEVHSIAGDEIDKIAYKRFGNNPYVLLENNDGRFLFAGGFQSDITGKSIGQQSVDVFRQVGECLEQAHFPVDSIIRQWNYIEQITCIEEGSQRYQSFNNARSDFYDKGAWPNGYPAATGIGANLGGVVVDLDAAIFASPGSYASPVDNPLQIAAHTYSGKVLKTAGRKAATPKFERAKSITFGNRRLVYISGTAAIRGENSLHEAGLERQLCITMENIARLTGKARLIILRVYLKNKADYALAERLIKEYRLPIPVSYMCADVCRDELLIEIEGIAIE